MDAFVITFNVIIIIAVIVVTIWLLAGGPSMAEQRRSERKKERLKKLDRKFIKELIKCNYMLNREYLGLLFSTRHKLLDDIPSIEDLEGTIFEDYFSLFYKTKSYLAVLNMMAKHPDKLRSQFPKKLIEKHSLTYKESMLLSKYPWLIEGNCSGESSRGNDYGNPGDVTL